MPVVVTNYQEGIRRYLEICTLNVCKHEVGKKVHYIFEFPTKQDPDEFMAEALTVVAEKGD